MRIFQQEQHRLLSCQMAQLIDNGLQRFLLDLRRNLFQWAVSLFKGERQQVGEQRRDFVNVVGTLPQ